VLRKLQRENAAFQNIAVGRGFSSERRCEAPVPIAACRDIRQHWQVDLLKPDEWSDEMREERRLLQERFDALIAPWEKETPSSLYHFTSSHTLVKILQSRVIRLYSVFDMKDTEEFIYPLHAIWESMQPYWGALIVDVTDLFNPRRRVGIPDVAAVHAACFCPAECEFMWANDYGDRFAGAAIRLDAAAFCAVTPDAYSVYPMVYDGAEFKTILDRLFDYVVQRDWTVRFNFREGRTVAFELSMLLVQFLARMKRESFRSEEEWRALRMQPEGRIHVDPAGARRFIERPLSPKHLSAILLGSRSTLREDDVSEMLREFYGEVPVFRSHFEAEVESA